MMPSWEARLENELLNQARDALDKARDALDKARDALDKQFGNWTHVIHDVNFTDLEEALVPELENLINTTLWRLRHSSGKDEERPLGLPAADVGTAAHPKVIIRDYSSQQGTFLKVTTATALASGTAIASGAAVPRLPPELEAALELTRFELDFVGAAPEHIPADALGFRLRMQDDERLRQFVGSNHSRLPRAAQLRDGSLIFVVERSLSGDFVCKWQPRRAVDTPLAPLALAHALTALTDASVADADASSPPAAADGFDLMASKAFGAASANVIGAVMGAALLLLLLRRRVPRAPYHNEQTSGYVLWVHSPRVPLGPQGRSWI
jgi:flagellar biosynthesis regulator FlaF